MDRKLENEREKENYALHSNIFVADNMPASFDAAVNTRISWQQCSQQVMPARRTIWAFLTNSQPAKT
jgi:hypothetical protein